MWLLSELAMCANFKCTLGYMGSCRILCDTHVPCLQAKDHFQIESKLIISFLEQLQPNLLPSLHFFSGQSRHASSSSIVLYLWLGARMPTASTNDHEILQHKLGLTRNKQSSSLAKTDHCSTNFSLGSTRNVPKILNE
jgi:hypothetical protein